jgi:hypothetical protein
MSTIQSGSGTGIRRLGRATRRDGQMSRNKVCWRRWWWWWWWNPVRVGERKKFMCSGNFCALPKPGIASMSGRVACHTRRTRLLPIAEPRTWEKQLAKCATFNFPIAMSFSIRYFLDSLLLCLSSSTQLLLPRFLVHFLPRCSDRPHSENANHYTSRFPG